MGAIDRSILLQDLKAGGRLEGTTAIYHRNFSTRYIGVFDEDLIRGVALAGVKWIAHVGAGYDKIDVLACKTHGISLSLVEHIAQ